ncbi:nucleoside monophosphate kinase [Candidatus Peregrinibacteria bacterium]|nr:nucleoside monophosphate kinase [Candidatus Peregrinibacteria bacterium]
MDYVLFGIQGSGKGTQGKILAEKLGLEMFETGAFLRILAKKNSTLGKKVKNIIEAGHLVPSEVVMEIVENFLKTLPKNKNVLFDGIPRNENQAKQFIHLMKKFGRSFTGIFIHLSEKEAIKRLKKRRMCENCKMIFAVNNDKSTCEKCGGKLIKRKDDTLKSIQTRIQAFKKETMPVIEKLKKKAKFVEINGEQAVDKVNFELISKIVS